MDFLLDALGEIASEIFASVAHLLNLDVEIIFVDTTSTYWEVEVADELTDLDDDPIDDDGKRELPGATHKLSFPTSLGIKDQPIAVICLADMFIFDE